MAHVKMKLGNIVADVHPEMVEDYKRGGYAIIEAQEPEAIPDREAIAKMRKADVLEWMEAVDIEPEKGASLSDLRDALARAMFVNM